MQSAPRRKRRWRSMGRQATAADRMEVRRLVAGAEANVLADRSRLIENLHAIQDTHGHVPLRLLVALAEEMRLPLAHVFEVATFYAYFDVVREDEDAPPPITIRVCTSLPCMLAGAEALLARLRQRADASQVRIIAAPCQGGCDAAPFAMIGKRRVGHANAETLLQWAENGPPQADAPPDPEAELQAYRQQGGLAVLEQACTQSPDTDAILQALEAAELRGLGGAGFPAHLKWRAALQQPGPRHVVINADEGEPGTFKDRVIMEEVPLQMLEGALIAAHAVQAQAVWIYLRDEYPHLHARLSGLIGALEQAGVVPAGFVRLRRGAGAYICGEETALVESLEGRKGWPRQKPPYLSEDGLFGQPTLMHNVETITNVVDILRDGADAFAARGKAGHAGGRRFSISGRVRRPGVYAAPAGSTVRELIELAGGMAEGHTLAAFLPGGASGGILPARLADVPLNFGTLEEHGAFVGSHALIVLSRQDDLRRVAHNLMTFFAHESCGQCTPCRLGCEKAKALLAPDAPLPEKALLEDLALVMQEGSICGLGQAAPNVFLSLLRHFPEVLS